MIFLQKNEGFTLIEIMVALLLGLILFLTFSSIFISGLRSEGDIDNKLKAKNVANSIVEYIRKNKNLENDNDIVWGDVEKAFDDDEVKFIDDPAENIKIDSEYNNVGNIYEVEIEIKWQERGNERSYSLHALLLGD